MQQSNSKTIALNWVKTASNLKVLIRWAAPNEQRIDKKVAEEVEFLTIKIRLQENNAVCFLYYL